MRILVACEFSGIVRDAFAARGHDAWSCDLLPSEKPGQHIQGDVLKILNDGWDMMIAHPDCTYLCNSGVRWLHTEPGRREKMEAASLFFWRMLRALIPMIAVENPIPHRHAELPPYSQIVQPWQFGHKEMKATALWLRGLPLLRATKVVGPPPKDKTSRKAWQRVHRESPGLQRWKNRARTYPGIAQAMATQWGQPDAINAKPLPALTPVGTGSTEAAVKAYAKENPPCAK